VNKSKGRSGYGSGKLLLFGEHSAVYGYPALGLSLNIRTVLHADTQPDHGRIPVPELVLPQLQRALNEIRRSLEEQGVETYRVGEHFSYSSSVPMGSGFGSSASACVALARLLAPEGTGERLLWEAANRGEGIFHGRPSGIDTGLALGGGLFALYAGDGPIPRRRALPRSGIIIQAGYIPRERSTRELIEALAALREKETESVEKSLKRLGGITEEAITAIDDPRRSRQAETLAHLANEAHSILRMLGLSTGKVETVMDITAKEGALGSKISGAGGGGAFYSICPNMQTAIRIRKRLDSLPFCSTIEPFSGEDIYDSFSKVPIEKPASLRVD
jgi:mevalonate kinase